jgi:multicomponent Na+:H+ antiporter subunit D
MTISAFPPGILLVLGGLVLPFVAPKVRATIVLVLPLIVLWSIWQIGDGVQLAVPFLDYELAVVKGDALSRLFATVFAIMAFAGGLYALNQKQVSELAAAFVYAGSAIGVAFAGDLITVFVFWEIMALGSTMVIWAARTPESYKASMRYLMIHLLGGILLMVGIVAHVADTGSVAFQAMTPHSFGTWLMLAGFLINAGAPPLTAWLPDAYPEASFSGTVFLSAFTTKTAVYVLIRGFPGAEILIYIGVYMIFYGIIYALLENDARRILSYSIINQVGFMITGIGIGGEMALNGAAAHAFTHIIYKGLLLMSAGSVLYMTGGKRKCTDLGGLFQSMPLTCVCGIIGALAISSFPLTSGFISKSMIAQAASDQQMFFLWMCLAAASAGVFLHAGIKFPWFVFFQKDSGLRPKDPPWNMKAAMIFFAFLCIALGVAPGPLYDILPFSTSYEPYTVPHVVNQLQLLLFAGLSFFLALPLMKRTLTISLDWDWFYRRLGEWLVRFLVRGIVEMRRDILATLSSLLESFVRTTFRSHGPDGIMARTNAVGPSVAVIVIMLTLFMLVFYIGV